MTWPSPLPTRPGSSLLKWLFAGLVSLSIALSSLSTAWAASAPDTVSTPAAIRLPPPPSGFNRHDGGFIQYAYPPDARAKISKLLETADLVRRELSDKLGTLVLHDVHVRIARTPVEMSTLAPENAPYPPYAMGVNYPELGLILLTLEPLHPNQPHDILEIFRHELAHQALYDAVKGRAVPRWFNEGFAVFVSGESSIPRLQTLWTATVAGNLIPLRRLDSHFPNDAQTASLAYAEAVDVVRYLVRRQERYRFDALVEQLAKGESFDRALAISYGIDQRTLEVEWRDDISRRYTIWPIVTSSTVLWAGILVLFVWGYRRRKARSRATLERWRKEEAKEDARNATRRLIFEQALRDAAQPTEKRVHIVVASPGLPIASKPTSLTGPEVDVPKIEHDGNLHTVH